MHKKPATDKKTGAHKRPSKLGPRRNPMSFNELMSARPALRRLTSALPAQLSWADWLRTAVPAELADHIVSVVPKGEELVIFADSAGWCGRLRYALAGMQAEIAAHDAGIRRTRVRVLLQG